MNTSRSPADAGPQRFRAIPTTSLRVGAELESPILDVDGGRSVLLVAERTVITAALISQLSRRGISEVQIELADFERMMPNNASAVETPQEVRRRRRMSFQATDGANGETFGIREDSFIHQLDDPGAVSYEDAERREFLSNMDSAVDEVGDFFQALEHGGRQHQPGSVATSSLSDAVHDLDLFVSLGVNSAADSYPHKHSVQVSMLAMALGTTMGLNEVELRELGTGCLIHDGGMLMIRDRVWAENRQLSKMEFLEITRHPGLVYDCVCERGDLSTGTCMVVYQMHERWNGSGYPRQRTGSQIHPLARIASVADTFVALVCPRPHRPAILPYQAMEKLIHGASQGLFDPDAVRGLLHTVSLFPVTSFVVTTDGRVGRVIRTNGDLYTQPVLDVWDPGDMRKPPEPVDLAEQTDLKVLRPLTQFEVGELGMGQAGRHPHCIAPSMHCRTKNSPRNIAPGTQHRTTLLMPLHPQAVQMVAQFSAARPLPLREMSLAEIRAGFQPGPPCDNDGVAIDDFTVSGPVGPVPVRRYVPSATALPPAAPVLIYLHGGGWVMGELPGYDCLCRPLAVAAGAVVLSVGYSLSPEQRFPVAVEECGAVLREAARQYHGADTAGAPCPLIVAGDSAGGNLAAAVALKNRDEAGPPLAAQLLIYPVLDFSFETPSYHENASGYVLTRDSMIWFWEQYLARPGDGASPYASPLRATSLEGLPPAFVLTCEYDPLRDEGERYAGRLHEAGVPTTRQRIDGMIHGYLRYTDVFDIAGETINRLGRFVREL